MEFLPKLQAEQALDRIAQTAAGSATMEESSRKALHAELRRTATQGVQAPKATAASLASMRIAVETID